MKWSGSTIGLFVLSMTFMVLAGFMLLMFMGTEPGAPGHDFARYGLPACVLGFFATGAGAWLNHRRQRNGG
jgi:hypothetical protein